VLDRVRTFPPVLKGLFFGFIPLSYYLFDKLNYTQAGLAAVLGFFTLATLFSWRNIKYDARKYFDWLLVVFLVAILLNLSFQAMLRDVMHVQPEDVVVIQSIFSTDVNEATEFFIQYGRYILFYLLLFSISFLMYWFLFVRAEANLRVQIKDNKRSYITAGIITFLLVAIHFNPTLRRSNPLYYFPYYYMKWQADVVEAKTLYEQFKKNSTDPTLNAMHLAQGIGPRTVVLVLGESDTRNNWSLYGYERETTPRLSALKKQQGDSFVVFQDSISGDASTIGSITKMLTPATMEAVDEWKTKPSIVPMAQKAGYKVIWVTNQGTENWGIVSILAAQADQVVFTNKGGSRSEGTFDEAVLSPFQQALDDPAERKLIVVHILGAHPSYDYRYPSNYAKFEGVMDDKVATQLSDAGRTLWGVVFRNRYDSAILYQDYVLSQSLKMLMKVKGAAAWMYISDHGQDVAHHDDFSGHNRSVLEMWQVPMLFWSNEKFNYNKVPRRQLENRIYQADVLDHAILGQLGIKGGYYNSHHDIFSADYDIALHASRNLRGLNASN
jgi:heptose-I-phosphate ethanolaminephosphotransferase